MSTQPIHLFLSEEDAPGAVGEAWCGHRAPQIASFCLTEEVPIVFGPAQTVTCRTCLEEAIKFGYQARWRLLDLDIDATTLDDEDEP